VGEAPDWRDRRLARERAARLEAERLLEAKSLELYQANQQILTHARELEAKVTERTEALAEALEAAQAAARSKTEFLAVLSHEMRTPVHGLLAMAELLHSTSLEPEQRNWLRNLRGSGKLLLALIDDLLDFADMDAEGVRLHPGPLDIRRLLSELMETFSLRAEERDLALRLDIDPGTPQCFAADESRVRQIFVNLIGNALKFTHQGEVTVTVKPRLGGAWVDCQVRDTGIGIAPERRSRLFRLFSQADGSIRREYGGTGLGLAVCQRLVDAMGGTLGVDSVPERGSVFHFTLPCLPVCALPAQPLPTAAGLEGVMQRVLVVEDNPVNQLVAQAMLERLGIAHELAEDGEQAVDMVRRGNYDIILMDMQLPRLDGPEATRRIRALAGITQPRIIAVSANVLAEDRQRCLEAGMDDTLSKPFSMSELAALFGLRGQGPELEGRPAGSARA
jgi:two-component system, sensor histidine kinase